MRGVGMVLWNTSMEIYIVDFGKMVKEMGKAVINIVMGILMMVNSRMIKSTGMEC